MVMLEGIVSRCHFARDCQVSPRDNRSQEELGTRQIPRDSSSAAAAGHRSALDFVDGRSIQASDKANRIVLGGIQHRGIIERREGGARLHHLFCQGRLSRLEWVGEQHYPGVGQFLRMRFSIQRGYMFKNGAQIPADQLKAKRWPIEKDTSSN